MSFEFCEEGLYKIYKLDFDACQTEDSKDCQEFRRKMGGQAKEET
jgi:hypothetical protein